MSKIWVIEEGSYSDYRIVGVFSTKENAMVIYNAIKQDSYDVREPVEWELDPNTEEIRKGYLPFQVEMKKDGTVKRCDLLEMTSYNLQHEVVLWWSHGNRETESADCIAATILATDATHAIKITNEHRAQMIANGEWK